MICLAIVQGVDNYYYGFYEKQKFIDFCRNNNVRDEILVILQGGCDKILTIESSVSAEWML